MKNIVSKSPADLLHALQVCNLVTFDLSVLQATPFCKRCGLQDYLSSSIDKYNLHTLHNIYLLLVSEFPQLYDGLQYGNTKGEGVALFITSVTQLTIFS